MKLKDSLEIVKIMVIAIFGLYVKNVFAYITYNLIRDWAELVQNQYQLPAEESEGSDL